MSKYMFSISVFMLSTANNTTARSIKSFEAAAG
jgi:hypothetical protein